MRPNFAAILASGASHDGDGREVTLRLDRSTLKVQHIRSVAISAHERIIFQHQSEFPVASDDIDSPY